MRETGPRRAVTPRAKGESLPANERRDWALSAKMTQERGAPPEQRLPPNPRPLFGTVERGSCRREDRHDPGQYGRHEVPTSRNPERRRGVSPPRATQAQRVEAVMGKDKEVTPGNGVNLAHGNGTGCHQSRVDP